MFRAVAVHLYASAELETNAGNISVRESGHDAINFRGVSIDHLVFAESAKKHDIFIYDIDIEEGELVGEMYVKALIYWETTTNFAILSILTRSSENCVALAAIQLYSNLKTSTVM